MDSLQVFSGVLITFVALFLVIALVRKRLLRTNYAILWIGVSILLMAFVVQYEWVVAVDAYFEIGGPKNIFFLVMIFFLLSLGVQFSIIISGLVLRVKNLAQKIALMEYSFSENKKKSES
jgi:hypothetical protein